MNRAPDADSIDSIVMSIINDPEREYRLRGDALDRVAHHLRDDCGYAAVRVKTTVSHFKGFDH